MSSENPKGPKGKISHRLAGWYSAIFVVTFAALFLGTFALLQSFLEHRDHHYLLEQLNEYAARYNDTGFAETVASAKFEDRAPGNVPFFIRISDPSNHTLYLSVPESWEGFDLTQLNRQRPKLRGKWIRLPKKGDEDVVEMTFARLRDGNMLEVGMSSESRNEMLEHFREFAAVLLPIAFLGILAGTYLSFRALRPLQQLIETVNHVVATGEMNARVPVLNTNDELSQLGGLFNRMFESVNSLVNGMKDSLDNVAHDLRTPLTRMQNVSEEALESDPDTQKYADALVTCYEESQRVASMLKTLMDISEAEAGTMTLKRETIDAGELIEEVAGLYQDVSDDKKIRIAVKSTPDLSFSGDRLRMRQAISNLLDNALKFTPEGGNVLIEVERRDNQAVITVTDSGVGISPTDLPKIWDRLYRGDQSRSTPGLGLGLSFVKAITHAHRGSVDVSSRPGSGSSFSIQLPILPSLS